MNKTAETKVKWADILFSGYEFYRKWKGGIWCQVAPTSFPEILVWVQNPNQDFEKIINVTYYVTKV